MFRTVAQPFDDGRSLHEEIIATLSDARVRRFYAITAWAKRSGLSRLAADMLEFKRRGGTSALLAGIDEGGATMQGLRLAVDLFDRVNLVHDRAARTFHPKIYVGTGPEVFRGYIGSGNLTAGGLYGNYEFGLAFELGSGHLDAHGIRRDLAAFVARLYQDRATCRRLTRANVEAVIADPSYRVADEDRRRWSPMLDASPDSRSSRGRNVLGFGTSGQSMRRAPPTSGRSRRTRGPASTVRSGARRAAARGGVAERWFKKMSRSDAQQARPGSNPTGNLRLAQAGHDIDHTTYFRHVLFGGEQWRTEPAPNGTLDVADVEFDVIVGGRDSGRHTLRVDHADFRVANQRNIATFLHWGSLAHTLRRHDYTNRYVAIERRVGGQFRLELRDTPPGTAI